MLRTSTAARVLTSADREAALAVCDRDPVANAFVASRLLEQRAFTPAGGELTPTLKVRRRLVEERHTELIAALYDGT